MDTLTFSCSKKLKQNNENVMIPTSIRLSELKEADHDDVNATIEKQLVNMTPNPAYGNNASIKMDENPAYRCFEK